MLYVTTKLPRNVMPAPHSLHINKALLRRDITDDAECDVSDG
ncbi:hypothetical protein CU668_27735 [Pseudomonas syringae pv. actinidifoliorum]|nr:hypothetical protein [Pseudomonas syringae pv. actinidifoliorum]